MESRGWQYGTVVRCAPRRQPAARTRAINLDAGGGSGALRLRQLLRPGFGPGQDEDGFRFVASPASSRRNEIRSDTSQPKIASVASHARVAPPTAKTAVPSLAAAAARSPGPSSLVAGSPVPVPVPVPRAPLVLGLPPVLQDVVMEPQPGSPTSPPFSPGTTLWDNARAATPSEEVAAPDEPKEEATELEPGRKSTASSSSSSSSSSASSADIPCDIDVVELPVPVPDDEHGAEVKAVDSATPEDERAGPAEHGAEAKPVDCAMPEGGQAAPAVTVHSAEAKPDDWVTWPEPPPPVVDDSFASSDGGGGGGAPAPLTEAPPQVHTVSPANLGAAGTGPGASGFDPGRIPASVFQHRTSVSQAEWSMASNESLFSIQGASDLYPGSRSHFDFYYDEAMAEAADSKLPSLAEGAEPGDAPESREFAAPGSAESAASAVGGNAKRAAVFRQHESGSGSSSSNFSFAFPILAETSPRKKDVVVNSALYRPLEKEREQPLPPPQLEPPVSAFMEMTTEEERRRSDSGCCCCGCCWFDCSWCCRCPWWRCGCCCSCSCPSFCRCSWCLCS